mgnify:CR=1 FL=1
MKPLRVFQDIVPMAEFKAQAAQWFRRVAENNQPVVITQNGKPAGVLLSPAEFDRLVERQRFIESVAAGVADLDAGRVMTTDELKRRLGLDDDPADR